MIPNDVSIVTDAAELRRRHPAAMSRATDKVLDHLDRHCRAILALVAVLHYRQPGAGRRRYLAARRSAGVFTRARRPAHPAARPRRQ